ITVAAQAWAASGREPAALLRGGQLALAAGWAATEAHRAALSQDARDFVDAGVAEERAQQAAERRRTRRLRQLVAALTVAVLVAAGLAGYAFRQRQIATTAKDEAESQTVAVEAGAAPAPAPAAQLSLAAYKIGPTAGARASLLESSGAPSGRACSTPTAWCRPSRCPVTAGCSPWRPRTGRCGCGTCPGRGTRR